MAEELTFKNGEGGIRTRAAGFIPTGRFSKPLNENDNHKQNKDLPKTQTAAYKPAYKNISEIAKNKTQIDTKKISAELAEIVTVWHELPEHIKAAIKALIQTRPTGEKANGNENE
ncbi:MAG: hypothetical protein ACYS0C_01780 [Planctomycetota bacterium]